MIALIEVWDILELGMCECGLDCYPELEAMTEAKASCAAARGDVVLSNMG